MRLRVTKLTVVNFSSLSHSWGTPVQFGEDTAAQGIYCLQHFGGEFWELGSLGDIRVASETRGHQHTG